MQHSNWLSNDISTKYWDFRDNIDRNKAKQNGPQNQFFIF